MSRFSGTLSLILPAPEEVAKKTFDVLEWLAAMCSRVPTKASGWFAITETAVPPRGGIGINERRQARTVWSMLLTRPYMPPRTAAGIE